MAQTVLPFENTASALSHSEWQTLLAEMSPALRQACEECEFLAEYVSYLPIDQIGMPIFTRNCRAA